MQQASIAMKGERFYSDVSLGPKAVIDNAIALFLDSINALDVAGRHSPLRLADYGAADGGTSMDLFREVIGRARRMNPNVPIDIHYTDLPDADFATLFQTLDGRFADRDSYLRQFEGVYAHATGLSFYRQLFPDQSIDVGFSASAMHYLSSKPCLIKEHIHATGASVREQAAFRTVAMKDWERILMHRARELAVGGFFICANLVVDDDGMHLGNTGGANLFDTYNTLWRAMRDDGWISVDEYANTAFQQFYLSVGDALRPLQDEASPVRQSGLIIDSARTVITPCPFRTAFEAGLPKDEFAEQFVNTHRSWTETTFLAGLDNDRGEEGKRRVVDELYRRYVELVRQSPIGHGKDLVHLYLVAKKVAAFSAL